MHQANISSVSPIAKKVLIVISVTVYFLFGLLPFHDYRFIFLAIALLVISYQNIRKDKIDSRHCTIPDIFLSFVVLLNFISFMWAKEPSLIWGRSFIWLSLFLTYLLTKAMYRNTKKTQYLEAILQIIYCIALFAITCLLLSGIEEAKWNIWLGYNKNFCVAFTVVLLPFILWSSRAFLNKPFQILALISINGAVIVLANSKAVLLVFILIIIYKALDTVRAKRPEIFRKNKYVLLSLLIVSISLMIAFLFTLKQTSLTERTFTIIRSFEIFLDHPVQGIGANNWHLFAYDTDIFSRIPSLSHPYLYVRPSCYNFFAKLLTELGLIGFLSISGFFSIIFANSIRRWDSLDSVEKNVFISILCSLIFMSIYESVDTKIVRLSSIQYLCFGMLGILSSDFKNKIQLNRKFYFSIFLSLAMIIFFVKNFVDKRIHIQCQNAVEQNDIQILNKTVGYLYNSWFSTSYGTDIPYPYYLGQAHLNLEEPSTAIKYFKQALKNAPNNEIVLSKLTEALIHKSDSSSIAQATYYADQLYGYQSNHVNNNLLKAEIAFKKNDCDDAMRFYGDILYRTIEHKDRMDALKKKIDIDCQ